MSQKATTHIHHQRPKAATPAAYIHQLQSQGNKFTHKTYTLEEEKYHMGRRKIWAWLVSVCGGRSGLVNQVIAPVPKQQLLLGAWSHMHSANGYWLLCWPPPTVLHSSSFPLTPTPTHILSPLRWLNSSSIHKAFAARWSRTSWSVGHRKSRPSWIMIGIAKLQSNCISCLFVGSKLHVPGAGKLEDLWSMLWTCFSLWAAQVK